jgi:hypothetical protein
MFAMAFVIVFDVGESSTSSNRKTRRGLDGRTVPACQATSHERSRRQHGPCQVKRTLQAHASWPSPIVTSDYLSRCIYRLSQGHSPNAHVLPVSAIL